jgi:predicted TIM-barrel fold metal-dependent hydrolase
MIDNHIHIGKSEKLAGRHLTFDSCYDLIKNYGVEGAGVMSNLSNLINDSVLNEEFMSEYRKAKHKEFFYPMIVIDPGDFKTFEQISEYKDEIIGLKYHPSISEIPLKDEKLKVFLEEAKRYNLPLLVHCGRHWRSHVKYVIERAKEFPSLTFIAAHMGGGATDLVADALTRLNASGVENVYLDTSAMKLPWLIEEGVRLVGADRILFGSDEPYADARMSKVCVDLCDIADEDKEKIFYKNFERLYSI